MKIPSVPREKLIAQDGDIHPSWRTYFAQLTQELQKHVSDEGYYVAQQTPENIDKLNTSKSLAGLVYEKKNKFMQVNTDGKYKNMSTYEHKTSDEIAQIPTNELNGRFIYDTDAKVLKVGVDNTIKTVTLT